MGGGRVGVKEEGRGGEKNSRTGTSSIVLLARTRLEDKIP